MFIKIVELFILFSIASNVFPVMHTQIYQFNPFYLNLIFRGNEKKKEMEREKKVSILNKQLLNEVI